MQQPVLYIWQSFADVIGQFSEQLVVYQCSEFTHATSRRYVVFTLERDHAGDR